MILAIDIGNTHMVLGCLDEKNKVIARFQMSSDLLETAHEYAAEMLQILHLEKVDPETICGAVISSVVPEVQRNVAKAVRILTGKDPLILGTGIRIGVEVDMNGLTADDIAGDLMATAVAAKAYYRLPAVIIDIGTATTVTAVNAAGAYIGGCILPGPNTALRGLEESTALLPAVTFAAPEHAIGKDTVSAMQSGIMYGSAGALDGILDRFIEEIGETPVILATGGMGKIIAPHCRHEIILDDALLLKGLGLIWKDNQQDC